MTLEETTKILQSAGADVELTLGLLKQVNQGNFNSAQVHPSCFPGPDGSQIIDMTVNTIEFLESDVRKAFTLYFPGKRPQDYGTFTNNLYQIQKDKLTELGLRLLSRTAYGILNGGSATSYGDEKKNKSYGDEVFSIYKESLKAQSHIYEGKPKGITPAFVQPDGSSGPSFMELKIRALLIQSLYHLWLTQEVGIPKLFQMTSLGTNEALKNALEAYEESPLISPLMGPAGWSSTRFLTGIQGLIGTFSPKDSQGKRDVFTYRGPAGPQTLALPGGHGHNFRVLEPIYRSMQAGGTVFAYLGNVDNLGFLPDPLAIAMLALKGAPAGFDFSFKTPVDVKGGILYKTDEGLLNCGDIGVAVAQESLAKVLENGNSTLLFNCATGVFNLEYLTAHLDKIKDDLPLRLSEQDKDLGKYAQVEQVTWEVLGLMKNPLIFAVEKKKRFLAAKLLIESFLTSGWKLQEPRFQSAELKDLKTLALDLNQGLENLLSGPFGMKKEEDQWRPLTVQELKTRFIERGLQDLRA